MRLDKSRFIFDQARADGAAPFFDSGEGPPTPIELWYKDQVCALVLLDLVKCNSLDHTIVMKGVTRRTTS